PSPSDPSVSSPGGSPHAVARARPRTMNPAVQTRSPYLFFHGSSDISFLPAPAGAGSERGRARRGPSPQTVRKRCHRGCDRVNRQLALLSGDRGKVRETLYLPG